MNLAQIDDDLREKILQREQSIGFVVYKSESLWLIDWDDYFTLDQQKNIDALNFERYKDRYPSNFTSEKWKKELQREFRNGIPTLTADLFPRYRDGETAKVVTTDMLHHEFFLEDSGQYAELSKQMEAELSFNTPMKEGFVQLRSRLFSKLPKFYVNYDRKIFMHMVRDRFFEKVVLDGWWGAECDFEHMIPTSHRYWVRSTDEDFWAVTNFSNH